MPLAGLTAALMLTGVVAACGDDSDAESLTVYSGRSESLIGPLLERFEEETDITVEVRYGSTTEMATTILEEGANSPADVFIAQDTGGLGAVQQAGLFEPLPEDTLAKVAQQWRSDDNGWVGLSGRARVLVYNNETIDPADLPDSILDLTDPEWSGRLGWAPTNASFQAFVTALRVVHGDDAAREWLEGMMANDIMTYPGNSQIVEAAAAGEIEVGLVNHYYLHRYLAEQGESYPARNYYTAPGDIGSVVGVAGAGILASSDSMDAAQRLIDFMLSDESQQYFADETYEYPVVTSVPANADLPALDSIQPPDMDLDDFADLEGTLALLREVGALE
ncbi:MAG: iron ABC transporter substrate-binding protein [Dehalococcoidia bacterium]